MSESANLRSKLIWLQQNINVPKNQWNDFGKYNYRSKEDILEAAKQKCIDQGCTITCDDSVFCADNGWVYIVATATITDAETGESISCRGIAREPESKRGMDASQITGTASSYAGKRALGNLFAIDDTKDSDGYQGEQSGGWQNQQQPDIVMRCRTCGTAYKVAPDTIPQDMNQFGWCAQQYGCTKPDYEIQAV